MASRTKSARSGFGKRRRNAHARAPEEVLGFCNVRGSRLAPARRSDAGPSTRRHYPPSLTPPTPVYAPPGFTPIPAPRTTLCRELKAVAAARGDEAAAVASAALLLPSSSHRPSPGAAPLAPDALKAARPDAIKAAQRSAAASAATLSRNRPRRSSRTCAPSLHSAARTRVTAIRE